MLTALVIFLATYVFLAGEKVPFLKLDRPGGAVAGAVAMVLFGVVTPSDVVARAFNWDPILLRLGMMILASCMARTGLFKWVSWQVLARAGSARSLLTGLVLISGVLSALLVNDTVCLMCTPLVVALIDDARLPPWPFVLALAFGSNAGSVATPTGNPQNMLVATLSGMGYVPFTRALLLPGILALITVAVVLHLWYAKELAAVGKLAVHVPKPELDTRGALVCVAVLLLVLVLFVLGTPSAQNHLGGFHPLGLGMAWTAMGGAALALVFSHGEPREAFARVDWTLLLFFSALFVVTFGVAHTGLTERIHELLVPVIGTSPWAQVLRFGAFTIGAAQVVSNVPFVLLAGTWIPKMSDPHLLWLSTAAVSTIAGNLTPVGSVANLIVLEGAGEKGRIPFAKFVAVGAACTFLPMLVALGTLAVERAVFGL
ncbi:MAG: anion permease [Deltaproteobacteria bacterium]|nr:anion permease [Deltaproteobacteria bacterium]